MSELDHFKQTFFQECEELLGDLEERLMALEEDGSDMEALHAVFRAIHSIKGGAGAFGFERLVSFAHTFETVLDMMRDNRLETSPDNVGLAVRAADVVADLVGDARDGGGLSADHETAVLGELRALMGGEGASGHGGAAADDFSDLDAELGFTPVPAGGAPAPAVAAPAAAMDDFSDLDAELGLVPAAAAASAEPSEGAVATWRIKLVPHTEMLQRANEPLMLVRELKTLGAVNAYPDLDRLPPLDALEPEDAYLGWTFELIGTASRGQIEEVFEFVRDDCELDIQVEGPAQAAPPPAPEPAPAPPPSAQRVQPPAPGAPKPAAAPVPAPAPAAVSAPAPAPKAAAAPPKEAPAKEKSGGAAPGASVRVELNKMDNMVNMVGELVIIQAMLAQQGDDLPADRFGSMLRGLDELAHHTRELQEGVMAMRAQPVKSVFSRMPRLVRELSAQTNKKINLVMSGENTEIDKTVIEQLGDPLVHMIRNACDHGLETPDQRLAVGKSEVGTIYLSAMHRSGKIVIEIVDDGRGINREKVYQKAVEKGLIAPNSVMTDEEIDNMILQPGFSTADTVSNISGRGVGMDVVLRNVQSIGGRMNIASTPGEGTRFTLTLPLTLAVMDGMIVRTGDQSYVIPLASIVESLRPRGEGIHDMAGGRTGKVLSIRGEYIPLVFLYQVFGIDGALKDPSQALVVIVETDDGNKIGIVVDEILGQQQIVIKSLEENFDPIEGISAATILGSGKVALIIDTSGVRQMGNRRVNSARKGAARRHEAEPRVEMA